MLAKPFGQWIVGAIGAAITAIGLGIGIAGLWGEFRRRLELKARERRLVVALGRFGFAARSLVFTMIGLFFSVRRARQAHCELFNNNPMGPYCWALPLRGCSPSGFMGWRKLRSAASPLPRAKPRSAGPQTDEERKRC